MTTESLTSVITALGRLRQGDCCEFELSLGYRVRLCLKRKKKETTASQTKADPWASCALKLGEGRFSLVCSGLQKSNTAPTCCPWGQAPPPHLSGRVSPSLISWSCYQEFLAMWSSTTWFTPHLSWEVPASPIASPAMAGSLPGHSGGAGRNK